MKGLMVSGMSRIRFAMLSMATIASLSALTACGDEDSAPASESPSVVGRSLMVNAHIGVWSDLDTQPKKPWTSGVDCTSYDFEGVGVQVLDNKGTILDATTFPKKGVWTKDDPTQTDSMYQWDGTCTFSVAFEQVPESPVYVVELDGWEPYTASESDLAKDDWTVDLDL